MAPPIVVVSVAAPQVTAAVRERFADELEDGANPATGRVVLRTCHRVELYLVDGGAASARSVRADPSALVAPAGSRRMRGEQAVRHLVRLAVGLESTVVGEDQILHQLRAAYNDARAGGAVDAALHHTIQVALRQGRRTRAWRVGAVRSLADVAVEAVIDRVGPLAGRRVLVVGAGRMGRLAAIAAHRAGAELTIASRDATRAQTLAAAFGGRAAALHASDTADDAASVIVALSGPWHPADEVVRQLVAGRLEVVDLSQPPAVGGRLREALGPRLVTVDALAARPQAPADARITGRLEGAVDEGTREVLAWHERREAADAARTLAEQSERERAAALERLWRELPHLPETDRARIEAMSRDLAARLLREPLERLGSDADGSRERAARELFGL